jgi:hypothetical protein
MTSKTAKPTRMIPNPADATPATRGLSAATKQHPATVEIRLASLTISALGTPTPVARCPRSAVGRARLAVASLAPPGAGKAHRWQTTDTKRPKFHRALETGSLILAELGARECGHISLDEALQLTALVALHDRDRGERYACDGSPGGSQRT